MLQQEYYEIVQTTAKDSGKKAQPCNAKMHTVYLFIVGQILTSLATEAPD